MLALAHSVFIGMYFLAIDANISREVKIDSRFDKETQLRFVVYQPSNRLGQSHCVTPKSFLW